MSDTQDPRPEGTPPGAEGVPYVLPVHYPPPPRPAPSGGSVLGSILKTIGVMILAGSIGLNILLLLFLGMVGGLGGGGGGSLPERYHSGTSTAQDKIAIIRIEGVLMEGMLGYAIKQIDEAAADEHVKAVVVRINSPGGSITASDDLHRRIQELKTGSNFRQKGGAKTVVVSMGAMAASGGYYIAAPAEWIMAENTTITGSIGVYAAFPNVAKLARDHGVTLEIIKAGDVKASGSMFHFMTPQERQLWQDMVDHAYDRFIQVVEDGRPVLKDKMREVVLSREIEDRDLETGKVILGTDGKPKLVPYVRKRADGGIYMADEAKKYQLIDEIGYLDAAIKKTRALANQKSQLTGDYKVITYERPQTLASMLFGVKQEEPKMKLDGANLAAAATPRLWFLMPQSEMAGIVSILGKQD